MLMAFVSSLLGSLLFGRQLFKFILSRYNLRAMRLVFVQEDTSERYLKVKFVNVSSFSTREKGGGYFWNQLSLLISDIMILEGRKMPYKTRSVYWIRQKDSYKTLLSWWMKWKLSKLQNYPRKSPFVYLFNSIFERFALFTLKFRP